MTGHIEDQAMAMGFKDGVMQEREVLKLARYADSHLQAKEKRIKILNEMLLDAFRAGSKMGSGVSIFQEYRQMKNYKKFRIEAIHDDKYFRVYIRSWLGIWLNAYIFTDYFGFQYKSLAEAERAIENYKNRFTEIN